MARPGQIELGTISTKNKSKHIWHACEECGKERWVTFIKRTGKPKDSLCQPCGVKKLRGSGCHFWKGGRFKDKDGYILIKLQPDDFFYPMVDAHKYVREHRLIVAKALSRCLLPWEVVHHKTGFAKDDNRYPETLQLISDKRFHLVDTSTKRLITQLKRQVDDQGKRITLLEAENILLQKALTEVKNVC